MNVTALLMHEACVLGVAIKHASMQHPNSRMGCFASGPFPATEVIGYYYGTILCSYLGRKHSDDETYGGVMSVARKDFLIWAVCPNIPVETPINGSMQVQIIHQSSTLCNFPMILDI